MGNSMSVPPSKYWYRPKSKQSKWGAFDLAVIAGTAAIVPMWSAWLNGEHASMQLLDGSGAEGAADADSTSAAAAATTAPASPTSPQPKGSWTAETSTAAALQRPHDANFKSPAAAVKSEAKTLESLETSALALTADGVHACAAPTADFYLPPAIRTPRAALYYKPTSARHLALGFGSTFAYLAVLDILVARKAVDSTSRFFILHTLANLAITVAATPDALRALGGPLHEPFGRMSILPVYLITGIFVYHLAFFRNVPKDEWVHHVLFGGGTPRESRTRALPIPRAQPAGR
jgi:hypothetical protein